MSTDPEFYLKKHHVMAYIEDAVIFLLERKDEDPKTRPYELLAEYFESIKKGTHVLFRDHSYICLTPHNRASFIRLFWQSYSEVAIRGDSMRVTEYFSLVKLLCHNFPSDIAHKVAQVLFSCDALENLTSFSDFLYTFQILFYYESFLKCCELICRDIASGQTPRNMIGCVSTMVISVPSTTTTENDCSRPGTGKSELGVNTCSKDTNSKFSEQLDTDLFLKAVTNLCQRMEEEPWECCPSKQVLVNVIAELPQVTFYGFILGLSRSREVNNEIGVLPDRNNLIIANKGAMFSSTSS